MRRLAPAGFWRRLPAGISRHGIAYLTSGEGVASRGGCMACRPYSPHAACRNPAGFAQARPARASAAVPRMAGWRPPRRSAAPCPGIPARESWTLCERHNIRNIATTWRGEAHCDHRAAYRAWSLRGPLARAALSGCSNIWSGGWTDLSLVEKVRTFDVSNAGYRSPCGTLPSRDRLPSHAGIFADPRCARVIPPDSGDGGCGKPQSIRNFARRRTPCGIKTSLDAGYFDKIYAGDPDPWHFETSDYERAKYEKTWPRCQRRTFRARA